MTVDELLEKLRDLQDQGQGSRRVIMAGDPEGNCFYRVTDLDCCSYNGTSVGYEDITEAMRNAGYSDEDIMEDGEPALCLWP